MQIMNHTARRVREDRQGSSGEGALPTQDFEKAASLRDREKDTGRTASAKSGGVQGVLTWSRRVDDEQIAEVLALDQYPGVQAHR